MAEHKLPNTIEEAKAAGYVLVTDVGSLERNLCLATGQLGARVRQLVVTHGVDCHTAPSGTLCFRQCYEDKHVGVVGYCGPNKTCDTYQGPC